MSDKAQVALVNMPFSSSKYPSIQLGTLSALLKSKGVPVDCHHLNVRFAHKIGVPLYEMICEKRALFGEWIFSYLLFRENPKRAEYPRLFKPVFEQVAKESGHPASFFEEMASRTAPQFLTWALTAIDWGQYKMVGFTSTFDQNVASLTILYCPQSMAVRAQVKNCGAVLDAMSSKNEAGCPLSLASCSNTGLNRRGYSARFGFSRNKR